MSVFRVVANANELNGYTRDYPLVESDLPVAPYFQSSMTISHRDTVLEIDDFEEDDFWISFYVSKGANNALSGGRYGFALYDADISTSIPLLGIIKTVTIPSSYGYEIQRYDGSSAVAMGDIDIRAANTLFRIDIHYRAHAITGRIAVYLDGILAAEHTGNTFSTKANLLRLRRLAFNNINPNEIYYTCYSGLFLSTTDSRSTILMESVPLATGAFDDWTGTASDVVPSNDEITTFIGVGAPNKRSSFTYVEPATIEDSEIVGVMLSSVQRESIAGYAPTAPFFRTSDGVNRDTDPVSVGSQYTIVQKMLPDNGGQPWTHSDIASGQMGVLSAD